MVAQNMLRVCVGNRTFFTQIFLIETALDLNECLIQIRLTIVLSTREPINELPSNISTMQYTFFYKQNNRTQVVRKGILIPRYILY